MYHHPRTPCEGLCNDRLALVAGSRRPMSAVSRFSLPFGLRNWELEFGFWSVALSLDPQREGVTPVPN